MITIPNYQSVSLKHDRSKDVPIFITDQIRLEE